MDERFKNAIAQIESNYNPNAVNTNRNGTVDMGTYQLNSANFPQYGVTQDSTPAQIDAAALQHMGTMPPSIQNNPLAAATWYHSGAGTPALAGGSFDPSKLNSEQMQYLNKFQQAYGGQPQQFQQQQPYLPPPDTSSLKGAYKKPGILDMLSGLAQIGGGMATSIIQARKRMPITGGDLINSGQHTLDQQQADQQKYQQAQNVLQYLNNPNIDPNIRSQAGAYLQAGNIDGALGVIHTAQNNYDISNRQAQQNQMILDRQMAMLKPREDAKVDAATRILQIQNDAKETNSGNRQIALQSLMKKAVTEGLQPEDEARLNTYAGMEKSLEPALDSSKSAELTKSVGVPAAASYALGELSDKIDGLYKQISTGRLGGRITNWSNYVKENPELAQAKFLGNLLRTQVAIGVMGESSKHAFQIEQLLNPTLPNDIMTPKELKSINEGIKQAKALMQEKAASIYLSKPKATKTGLQYYGKKAWEGYLEGPSAFSGEDQQVTQQPAAQGGEQTIEEWVKSNGGTIQQ